MISYLFLTALTAFFLGGGVFMGMRALVARIDIPGHDAKGYFLLAMLIVTLLSVATAFFGGNAYSDAGLFTTYQFLPEAGALLAVTISLFILLFGLKKVF